MNHVLKNSIENLFIIPSSFPFKFDSCFCSEKYVAHTKYIQKSRMISRMETISSWFFSKQTHIFKLYLTEILQRIIFRGALKIHSPKRNCNREKKQQKQQQGTISIHYVSEKAFTKF